MNPHITVSAPEPYIVQIVYAKAKRGIIDFFMKRLKVNFFSFLNINIISADILNKYTGKNDNVASIVINVNADTILF